MLKPKDEWRLFVVDDDRGVLRTVGRVLGSEGYCVSLFDTCNAALEQATQLRPDLAVVDIRMPDKDGFALMADLQTVSPNTEVILMTGSVNECDQTLIKAIRHNAFYFITKPFDREVLLALVERCLEMKRLTADNSRYLDRIRKELSSALALQKTMLPAPEFSFSGHHLSAAYLPCDELAGDYFDYAICNDGGFAILIADVVGHGASAAMLTSLVKSAFHRSKSDDCSPAAVISRLGEDMAAFSGDQFATVLCVKLLASGREVCYTNAGHEGGLVVDASGTIKSLETTCTLVSSAFPKPDPAPVTLTWHNQDALLLYTDGVTEAWGGGEMFGEQRLKRVVRSAIAAGETLSPAVVSAVTAHLGATAQSDDVTVVSLQQCAD